MREILLLFNFLNTVLADQYDLESRMSDKHSGAYRKAIRSLLSALHSESSVKLKQDDIRNLLSWFENLARPRGALSTEDLLSSEDRARRGKSPIPDYTSTRIMWYSDKGFHTTVEILFGSPVARLLLKRLNSHEKATFEVLNYIEISEVSRLTSQVSLLNLHFSGPLPGFFAFQSKIKDAKRSTDPTTVLELNENEAQLLRGMLMGFFGSISSSLGTIEDKIQVCLL